MRVRATTAVFLISGVCVWGAAPPPARAFSLVKPICSVAGLVSGLAGKACSAVQNGGRFIDAGKKLLSGHVGGAFKTALGDAGGALASKTSAAVVLAGIGAWVSGGAQSALHETASVLDRTTAPQLGTTWFSSTYWRVAGIAAVLTVPFLFAAAVQALVRSDLALLIRAALGYLPLAMLAVSIAAPVTMLLLAATDQLAAIVSSTAGNQSGRFLGRAGGLVGALTAFSHSPFLAFFIGLLTVAAAVVLWFELLARAAAVYVIVLLLPVAFAAFVWPARRVWAVRAVELLVALILSKFVIVAVLSLGGAAFSHSAMHNITGMLAGVVLLVLGAFAPWAMLRLLPLAEVASGAVGSLRGEARSSFGAVQRSEAWAREGDKWASRTAQMRHEASEAGADPQGDAARVTAERLDALAAAARGGRARAEHDNGSAHVSNGTGTRSEAGPPVGAASSPNGPLVTSAPAQPAPPAAGSEKQTAIGEAIGSRVPHWLRDERDWPVLELGPDGVGPWLLDRDHDGDGRRGQEQPSADAADPAPPRQPPKDGHL